MSKRQQTPLKVGFVICPGVAIMDLLGAHAVFGMTPDTEIHILWKDTALIEAAPRFPIAATTTFEQCPQLDILVVGAVPGELNRDEEMLNFISEQSTQASSIIGICGGVLLLGAVGLLEGRKATTNFHLLDALRLFGAESVPGGRVVQDGIILTAGPATGGFEAALKALAELRGDEQARLIELTIEYHPQPVFNVGTPELAGKVLFEQSVSIYNDHFKQCTDAAISFYHKIKTH